MLASAQYLTPHPVRGREPMDAMKTKTFLIHFAAAAIGVSAMAGNPHGGPRGFSGPGMNSGRVIIPIYGVAPGRGASAWAPGRSGNLPPGHGGIPPGQAMKQNRSFWGNWWGTPKPPQKTGWFGRSWFGKKSH